MKQSTVYRHAKHSRNYLSGMLASLMHEPITKLYLNWNFRRETCKPQETDWRFTLETWRGTSCLVNIVSRSQCTSHHPTLMKARDIQETIHSRSERGIL